MKNYLKLSIAALVAVVTVSAQAAVTRVDSYVVSELVDQINGSFAKIGQAAGSVSTNGESAVEYDGLVHKTTITLANSMTATDGSAEGETEKIYTFPAGRIYILGAAIDGTIVNNATAANTADTFVVAIGTAAANDDADLDDASEKDIIVGPTLEDGAVTLTNAWEGDMTVGADTVFDGTSTAASLNLNLGIADANITTNNFTATFTGTVSVFWMNLGDD